MNRQRLEENRRRSALGYGVPIGGLVEIVDIDEKENNYFVGSPPKAKYNLYW
jgi:hypothetical protein